MNLTYNVNSLKMLRTGKFICFAAIVAFIIFILLNFDKVQLVSRFQTVYIDAVQDADAGRNKKDVTVSLDEVSAAAKLASAPKKSSQIFHPTITADDVVTSTRMPFNLWADVNRESTDEQSTLQILNEDNKACWTKPTSDRFDEMLLYTRNASPMFQAQAYEEKNPVLKVLSSFNRLLTDLGIKAPIIEPSILYCLLSPAYQEPVKKKFDVSAFGGSKSVVTYGISEDDIVELQKENNIHKFRQSGFQPFFIQTSLEDWMLMNGTRHENETYTSRAFYMFYDFTFHLVVFQNRQGYLWHAGMESSEDNLHIPKTDMLFVNYPSAYEKFTPVSIEMKMASSHDFYIPSKPHFFLFQIPSSRFLECNLTRAAHVNYTSNLPKEHSSLSVEKFNSRTLVSVRNMKALLHPLLMNFWIFSGTMLGWYRECDVIPYTTDVDFGAWASEVEDLDYIITSLLNNKNLTLRERMGVLEQALEFRLDSDGLRVDLFFLYQINNGSWASGHRPSRGYFFKYYYPHFTLCSAELLGEKVQVPCETEKVILTEYGPDWMKPVSSWNYEASIRNRGPNIYWDKEKLEEAYHDY